MLGLEVIKLIEQRIEKNLEGERIRLPQDLNDLPIELNFNSIEHNYNTSSHYDFVNRIIFKEAVGITVHGLIIKGVCVSPYSK